MPLWKVYHPVGAFTAEDKKELARRGTGGAGVGGAGVGGSGGCSRRDPREERRRRSAGGGSRAAHSPPAGIE